MSHYQFLTEVMVDPVFGILHVNGNTTIDGAHALAVERAMTDGRKQYRSRARLLAELCTERGFYWKRVKLGRAAKYFRWANRLREVANG